MVSVQTEKGLAMKIPKEILILNGLYGAYTRFEGTGGYTMLLDDVVRCKDCEKQECCRYAQYLGDNGFCSNGERSSDQ